MSEDEHDSVGSVADEFTKLLGALSHSWGEVSHNLGEHIDTGSPECDWCPVCRTVRTVRELSPEVTSHLAVAASALAQAAAGLMAAVSPDTTTAPRQAGVEDIAVHDGDGDEDDWPTDDR